MTVETERPVPPHLYRLRSDDAIVAPQLLARVGHALILPAARADHTPTPKRLLGALSRYPCPLRLAPAGRDYTPGVRARAAARVVALRGRLLAHPRWRWMALMVVASGMMLSVVNVSIVNIALPAMAADLGVNIPTISWVVTGFLVTQATLLAVAGQFAGDLYGRRRIFVTGVSVLIGASVLCALAWDAPSLTAFRMLQAMGACAMAPTAYAYAAELFGPRERGAALGVMGGVLGMAPVLALNIAGVLVGSFGWRSVFWFSPVVGALVLAGAFLVLVRAAPARCRSRLRPPRRRPRGGRPLPAAGGPVARRGVGVDLARHPRGRLPGSGGRGALRVARVAREQPDDRPGPAAAPLLGHRQPGGHGLVGRPVRDAHPPAVLSHRGARVQAR